MSSFVKLVAVFVAGLLSTGVAAEKPADDKSKKPETKESGDKKSKKDKKKGEKPVDPDAPAKVIDVPVPKGHDAKGLKIPYFNGDGKLTMTFNIGVASRIDDTHIQMADLQVETFDDDGAREMAMDLPTSVLDLTTSVITAQKQVTIKREDFELTGNTMIFNTKTKQGGLGGKVRMLIYNLENETAQTPPAAPKPPTTPEPQAK
jgi:hypothetical protein